MEGLASPIAKDKIADLRPEDLLKRVIEACPVGLVLSDRAGKIVLANTHVERMFGYSQGELTGALVDILVPREPSAEHVRQREHFVKHPEARASAGRSLKGMRKDGSTFPVEVGLNPIDWSDDIAVLSVIADISDRRRNDRQKDEFVATVSHELRTPLTSISGALTLLVGNSGNSLPESTMRLLTIAHANSQRLVHLVNGILDMEKIESGKVVFVMKKVAVRPLVEQAIEANQELAETYNIRIRLDPPPSPVEIRTAPEWFVQILNNLLSNAVKFSPSGGEVAVAIENRNGTIRISVRDHGEGVPADFRHRIFGKFAQADATDTRQRGGAGLGLSIVKQLVTRLGGKVGFDDAAGGGAIFHVELPRCLPLAAPTPDPAPRARFDQVESGDRKERASDQ